MMDQLTNPEFVKDKIIKFYNCKLLRDHELVEDYLFIRNGIILDPKKTFWDLKKLADITVDCGGGIISPGFIDIQVNGSVGYDFASDVENITETVSNVSKAQLLMGVTSYCPTVVTSSPDVYDKVIPHIGPKEGNIYNGAEIIGAHLEGPFINPIKKGAHNINHIITAEDGIDSFYKCYGKEYLTKYVKYITVAPEVDGVMDSISKLVKETGIHVSMGHSLATVQQAETAFSKGCKLITHLFNAMSVFHQRDPGIVGMLGSPSSEMFYGIICDGIHAYPNSIKIAYFAHPKGAILVTDCMSAQCLDDGTYSLGDMVAEVRDGSVYLVGTNTIAGSVVQMNDCVKNFYKFTGATIVEALEAATLHPAQALQIAHKKGTLNYGADADILILDNDLNIKDIFIAGVRATPENVKYKSKF